MKLIYFGGFNFLVSPQSSSHSVLIPIRLGIDFSTPTILIKTTSKTAKSTWNRAGYIREELEVEGVKYRGKSFNLSFKSRRIITLTSLPFSLYFYPKYWIRDASLEIFEVNNKNGSI